MAHCRLECASAADTSTRITLQQLTTLADVLTPTVHSLQAPHIYTVCALRPIKQRINEHDQLNALVENPDKKYYQLRHSTSSNPSEFSRKFVSLLAIPIDGKLERDAITHRRLLCRIAETFFSI
jgi:hypothetical protein